MILLFTFPALLNLASERGASWARVAIGLSLCGLWGDFLRVAPGFLDTALWITQQFAWWGLFTILLTVLVAALIDSKALCSLRGASL